MTDPAQPWIDSARRALKGSEVLHAAQQWPLACFEAQQTAELALKAALAHPNAAPPRIHSIAELLSQQDQTVQHALNHIADRLRGLENYYTATRYPDAAGGDLPGEQDAADAIAAAREALTTIEWLIVNPNP